MRQTRNERYPSAGNLQEAVLTGFSAVGRSILATIGVALLGCIERPATTSSSHYETPATVGEPSIILLAAGDIADCNSLNGAIATARILGGIDGTIAALGDLAYPKGYGSAISRLLR